jgi:hypothetical protein
MRGKREIRRQAREAVYALLAVNLDTADGDLFTTTDGLSDAELHEFTDEVRRIMERVR